MIDHDDGKEIPVKDQFIDPSNSTTLYDWIQSINTTTMQVWVKNYNGSGKIDLEVLAKPENLFSATGYLGEANSRL